VAQVSAARRARATCSRRSHDESAQLLHERTVTVTGMWNDAPWHVVFERVLMVAPPTTVTMVGECAGSRRSRPLSTPAVTETPEVPGVMEGQVPVSLVQPAPPPLVVVTVTGPSWATPTTLTDTGFGFVSESTSVPVPPGNSGLVTVAVAGSTWTPSRRPTLALPVPEPVAEK
jgi:hypothetical protein